jgi:hypothetical protein
MSERHGDLYSADTTPFAHYEGARLRLGVRVQSPCAAVDAIRVLASLRRLFAFLRVDKCNRDFAPIDAPGRNLTFGRGAEVLFVLDIWAVISIFVLSTLNEIIYFSLQYASLLAADLFLP